MTDRIPMAPHDFGDRCDALAYKWGLSLTSGDRTIKRNAAVGGNPNSVHLLQGMARDYVPDNPANAADVMGDARRLGLWSVYHDKGSGKHLHFQAIPPLSS